MTLTYRGEVHEARGGRLEIGTGGQFTRTFWVETTDAETDTPYQVCHCPGLPILGAPLPDDPLYTCRTITPSLVTNPALSWYVTCEYSRRTGNPDEEQDNPLNAPVEISISSNKFQKAVTTDQSGNAIVNAAQCPFDPPPEITRSHSVVTFVRNEASYSFQTSNDYRDHVNNGSYLGGATGTVKCSDISATKQFAQDQEYWQVTYVFEYNPDGWQLSLLNVGYEEKADGTNLTKILDDNGRDVSQPWPLSVTGVAQSSPITTASFNYLDFTVYPSANFTALGLPT